MGAADAAARFKAGDKVGGTLASVSATLDALTAASALTGVGLPVAGVFGTVSMSIDVTLLIRDIVKTFFPFIPMFSRGGRVVRKYQGGGNTTRGGKPVKGAPTRTITVSRKKKPIKYTPPKTQPGKDVGGERKIKLLYPDPSKKLSKQEWIDRNLAGTYDSYVSSFDQNKADRKLNPFKALISTSKVLKPINLIGKILSAGVDLALGQKPDKRVFNDFFNSIGYIADNIMSSDISLISRQINSFAEGGKIPASRELRETSLNLNFGDTLTKVLGPMIDQKFNEALQNIRKEINKKPPTDESVPGGAGPQETFTSAGGLYGGYSPTSGLQKEIYDYLVNVKKLNDVQALGLMANISRESSFTPSQISGDDGGAGGLFQWKIPRSTAMARAVPDWKTNWKGQIDYALREPGEPGPQYISTTFSSAQEAADWWMRNWERPADKIGASRVHAAYLKTVPRSPEGTARFRGPEVTVTGTSAMGGMPIGKNGQLSPSELMDVGDGKKLWKPAAIQYLRMKADAKKDKVYFILTDGYRDLEGQRIMWNKYGSPRAARPGTSKHGLGKAIDISSPGAQPWIRLHGSKYGWIWPDWAHSSPREDWHFEYVGGGIAPSTPQTSIPGQTPTTQTPTTRPSTPLNAPRIPAGATGVIKETVDGINVSYYKFNGKYYARFDDGSVLDVGKERYEQVLRKITRQQGQSSSSAGIIPPQRKVIQALSKKSFISFQYKGNPYVFKVYDDGLIKAWPSISLPFNDPLPNFFTRYGRTGMDPTGDMMQAIMQKARTMYKFEKGGMILPSKPNRSIPNSFAPYENYGQGTMIAIQPIIIEKPIPSQSSGSQGIIAFPVPVSVNNNIEDMLSFNRG